MYLGPVPEDKLPKDAAPGRLLTGALALCEEGWRQRRGARQGAPVLHVSLCQFRQPAGSHRDHRTGIVWAATALSYCAKYRLSCLHARSHVVLLYSVPPKADADSKDGASSKADDEEKPKPPKQRLQEAVRDSKVCDVKLAPSTLPIYLRGCFHDARR